MSISKLINEFMGLVECSNVDIYNEFSFQHELGFYLRSKLPSKWKVQFERPISFFNLTEVKFEKKEIDISVFSSERSPRCAIELKYPRNGQYPEQMFKSCQDIKFLEQLVSAGFEIGYFIICAEDSLFYEGNAKSNIYKYFREEKTIYGIIEKPTGQLKDKFVINGSYKIAWQRSRQNLKFATVEIRK